MVSCCPLEYCDTFYLHSTQHTHAHTFTNSEQMGDDSPANGVFHFSESVCFWTNNSRNKGRGGRSGSCCTFKNTVVQVDLAVLYRVPKELTTVHECLLSSLL